MSVLLSNNTVASITNHGSYNRVFFFGSNKSYNLSVSITITVELLNKLYQA